MEGVFISRELAADSIFRARMQEAHIPLTAFSLIEFELSSFDAVPLTDWIFFYSKRGVHYFLEGCKKLDLPQDYFQYVQWACIGEGTATALRQAGYKLDFIGDGQPKNVAAAFSIIATGKRALFPQAQWSRQSVQKLLSEHIQSIDLIVYTNKPKSHYVMESRRILVFTSPLNAEAYFHRHDLQPGQRIVAIGNTTADALRRLGFHECTIAKAPNEQALANAVFECYEC
ncbi:MAG: uroporphyrinogen-III synthase [Bacteroidota bacterium]